jgi:hypothetical protein
MTMTKRKKINLRVAYLWLIHDFKAYSIFQDGVAMDF